LEAINRSSHQILVADNRSTAIKINDAEQAIAIAENRSINPDVISEARAELVSAKNKFDEAQINDDSAGRCCTVDESLETQSEDLNQTISNRQESVDSMSDAYEDAQRAIQILDDAGLSRLHINTRKDPVADGETRRYINGSIFVVSPEEVDSIYVEINDNRTATYQVVSPNKPLSNASFLFEVKLTQQVNVIEVTANSSVDNSSVPIAYDSLKLDGDGLRDKYETDVTGTDPTDPDSSSNLTTVNESDNGVIDSQEDFDKDAILTINEQGLGTNPVNTDTDSDQLSDSDELSVTMTDPVDTDSNKNGLVDGADDPDGDGLTNVGELESGTDPNLADSDSDGLNDPDELTRGTDPFNADTDEDFLRDGTEVQAPFNTDPTNPDTDGDGTVDGNETYRTSKSNISQGVEVDVLGEGNAAADVSIENGQRTIFKNDAINSDRASEIVEITSSSEFESAEITVLYDEEEVEGDESDLSLFRYNETYQTFLPVESTVNPVSDSVTTSTTHFSIYVVMNETSWVGRFADVDPPSKYTDGEDVALVMDTSGSMDSPQYIQILRNNTGKHYVGQLDSANDRAAVIDFDSGAYTPESLTNDFAVINSTIDDLGADGGTDLEDGIREMIAEYDRNGRDNQNEVGILIADGKSDSSGARHAAQDAAEKGIVIHTIGMGDANNETMQDIAQTTGGIYKYVNDTDEIPSLPEVESKESDDTDRDGIPDQLEQNGMRTGLNNVIYTDPNSSDNDSDGLDDGKEILTDELVHTPLGSFYAMKSNPLKNDTDEDGLSDRTETVGWTVNVVNKSDPLLPNPYRYDHRDETNHRANFSSDPTEVDTDNDGVNDHVEKTYLKTNPRRNLTYGVTVEHQILMLDAQNVWENAENSKKRSALSSSYQNIGILDSDESPENLTNDLLSDSNDDFDFLYTDTNFQGPKDFLEVFTYRTPDPDYIIADYGSSWVNRTDTWYPGSEEARTMSGEVDSAWDPDSDDDGLTDGQEHRNITKHERSLPQKKLDIISPIEIDREVDTDATKADTDGDGYWDGWLGVNGAENSRHVVMYMELLNRDNMTGNREVTKQGGIYEVPDKGVTATQYGNNHYRSNIQIGELHWGTDPTDASSEETPNPTLTVEVDYYAEANTSDHNHTAWAEGIEQNWALYGIDIDITRDETIYYSELFSAGIRPNDGFSGTELFEAGLEFNEDFQFDEYWLVATESSRGDSITGLNVPHSSSGGIFAKGVNGTTDEVSSGPLSNSPYNNEFTFVAASTMMHELGHSLYFGRADDKPLTNEEFRSRRGEVYTGSGNDPTIENLNGKQRWPVMSRENPPKYDTKPMEGRYFAFSVEETGSMKE
jgi:hypothetical protein